MLQVRLDVDEGTGEVTVTTFSDAHLVNGDWDVLLSAPLDAFMRTPNALYDIAVAVHYENEENVREIYRRVEQVAL